MVDVEEGGNGMIAVGGGRGADHDIADGEVADAEGAW